jgi:quercetin dioxygenase-like cupin family protein
MSTPTAGPLADRPDRARGILLGSHDTAGALALVEYDIPPRTLVAPLHTHHREDEYSYVLTGVLGAQIAEQTITAGPGELLAKRCGIPHTLWNPGEQTTRVLELIAPAGFEQCLAQLYRPGRLTPAELQHLWERYEIDMNPDSVPELMRRHQLRALATQ